MRLAGLVFFILFSSWYHPVHVSVTNIDIDPETGQVGISIKLFSDDFEDLIFSKYGVKLHITAQEDPDDKIDVVNRYISEALRCLINGNDPVSLEYSESRLNEEAIWLSYVYTHKGRIREMKINNTLMLEKFEDQTNLLILSYGDMQNGYRMNNKNTELSLSIKQ
jgi:hypothetical protein